MKLRIATVLMAGIVGMTMLFAGGCCHMHRHSCDRQSCCSKSACCDQCSKCDKCNKQVNCDNCDKPAKPCCDKTAPQAPKAEQK